MCLTSLCNSGSLVKRAAHIGVSPREVVPKGRAADESHWASQLLQVVHRLWRQAELGVMLPRRPVAEAVYVRVLAGSVPSAGVLRLEVNGRKGNVGFKASKQGQIVSLLMERAGEVVLWEEIEEKLGISGADENMRKQWLKPIRAKIRSEWLALPRTVPGRPELAVLESVDGGVVLHASVEWAALGFSYTL